MTSSCKPLVLKVSDAHVRRQRDHGIPGIMASIFHIDAHGQTQTLTVYKSRLLYPVSLLPHPLFSRHSSIMPATGADIPPELWPRILEYVGTDDRGERINWVRNEGEALRELKSCSLVCVDWDNRCRPMVFWNGITVCSQKDMELLDSYAKHGSKRIVPIAHRIWKWTLEQTWALRSWCHLRYTSSFRITNTDGPYDDGKRIELRGPVPSSLPVSALHSPHWSLPRSMPACYTPFVDLKLTDIHFPSLSSLFKLVRHFKSLRSLHLKRVTWDQVEVMAPVPHSRITDLNVTARGCTDNVYALRALADLCPRHAFGRLRPKERHACLAWVQNGLVPPPAAVDRTDLAASSLLGARNDPDTSFVSKECSIQSECCSYHPGILLTACALPVSWCC